MLVKMAKCICCGKELTKRSVFGGFIGLMYRLVYKGKGWEDFKTCYNCRSLSEKGLSCEEIRRL